MSNDDILGRLYRQQMAVDKAKAEAETAAISGRLGSAIQAELTPELQNVLCITISGATASFHLKGKTFTMTYYSGLRSTQFGGGGDTYWSTEWTIQVPDTVNWLTCAGGKLQSYLLHYLGSHGYI